MADDARLQRLTRELFLAAAAPSAIPAWVIERLASNLEDIDLRAGAVVFSAGDAPEHVYFIREGRVRTTREGGAPIVYEGRWALGGFDALRERPYTRTATAPEAVRIQRLAADAWLEALEDSFEMASSMVANAARTVRALETAYGAPEDLVEPAHLPHVPAGALTVVQRLATLMAAPALRGAGVQTLADLAPLARELTLGDGEALSGKVAGESAFVVFEGGFEAPGAPSSGRTRRFGPGNFVHPALLGAERQVTELGEGSVARSTGRTRALSFRFSDVLDLMEEHFDLSRSMLADLGERRERVLEAAAAESGQLLLK